MTPAYQRNGQPVSAQAFYAIACDPARNVAVEACAGAGKTWMLVSRILRALLDGCAPQDILAITFTKKAAGEMRQRLEQWLQAYASLTPEQAVEQLLLRGVAPSSAPSLVEPLQNLYQTVLMQGRSAAIQTFHSWFATLLRGAPLAVLSQLGLPTRYELLEDDARAVAQVWPRLYRRLLQPELAQQRADFEALLRQHGRSQVNKALSALLARRLEVMAADQCGRLEPSVAHFSTLEPDWAGLAHPAQVLLQPANQARWQAWAQALGQERNKTPQDAARAIVEALTELRALAAAAPGPESSLERVLASLRRAFFVADADRLTQHLQKFPAAQSAELALQRLCAAARQHQAWQYHQRMVRVGRVLLREYASLKHERGWVDMSDLELTAHRLLSDPVLGGWVQERLDMRIRHLLIDEFQDTNPMQWQALHAWLSSYAGVGGGCEPPSLFIVGDPKQSIYRFRRAEPQVFLAAQQFVLDLGGELLSCDHTRRNAPALVERVNRVMAQAQQDTAYPGFRPHTTDSSADGRWLALPPIMREPSPPPSGPDTPRAGRGAAASHAPAVASAAASAIASTAAAAMACASGQTPAGSAWRDSLHTPRQEAEQTLREQECRQVARWLAAQLQGALPAQEVLVLARKRDRLVVMEQALRELHIPAQQPEKSDLAQSPVVQDLLALLDALISPTHDLALARALRSPIFRLDDDDLVRLAAFSRRVAARCWREALQNQELSDPVLIGLEPVLARWSQWLAALPPHDALQMIVSDGDLRARYAAAAPPTLRPQVLADLDALLAAALQLDGGRYISAYTLLRAFKAGGIPAPLLSAGHAVRLLTIHGAKGLEAGCVILLDTDAPAPRSPSMGVLVDWPGQASSPQACVFLASESNPPPSLLPLLAHELQARGREELNGLYVALTRARHTVVFSSVEPNRRSPAHVSWWQRLAPLAHTLSPQDLPDTSLGPAPGELGSNLAPGGFAEPAIRLAVLPQFHRRLTPPATASALGGHAAPAAAADDAAHSIGQTPDSLSSRIGQAMHRLLEHQALDAQDMQATAIAGVAQEFGLDEQQAAQAAQMARRILRGQGAWAWSSAEVSWYANEVPITVAGKMRRIDRLVRRSDGCWWVLDYKSAADPAGQEAARLQLRRYRDAVQASLRTQAEAAQAPATVRAAFLTARGELITLAEADE